MHGEQFVHLPKKYFLALVAHEKKINFESAVPNCETTLPSGISRVLSTESVYLHQTMLYLVNYTSLQQSWKKFQQELWKH